MAGQPPPEEEQPELGQAPKVQCLQDSAWVTQQRVLDEIPEIQPDRLQIEDFLHESEATNKVIVPNAVQYERAKWEFPEEEEKPLESVPKVKTQDWVAVNDVEKVILKTEYGRGRIQRSWPPPGYGEEEQTELQRANQIKAKEDGAWIQGQQNEEEQEEKIGNAPWSGLSAKTERVWPPPENEVAQTEWAGGPRLSVQWPPPEFEEKSQKNVEIIQTHYPVKAKNIQWPPVKPGQEAGELPEEVPATYA
uniref:Y43F8B.1b-like protein n=2 Tax=Bursaphelenchus xylophilus TaxID=6326 RepID=D1MBQ2_BURXY|nr:Y43F8B.1b-like protein [Bursaphelenchus xylophilus]